MRRTLCFLATIAVSTLAIAPTRAQVRPIYDMGAAGLTQILGRLQTTGSALHTGAHPDDEDSAFMARTARGDHARTAYLALNRGEGGQNIIGTELFDALGVIRTEELLQARRLDGGEQFFTRTFDYGFSKSLEEASAKWDDRQVLGDMVRIIRTFRPLIIYSRFTGTPADGHGHHQMAGYLTPQAFRAAADPAQFPEQIREGLRPWQARKLYRGVGFRADPANPPTVQVQSGIVDPLVGRSFAEISFEGRSQHKSQEMGTIETRGPISSGLILIDSKVVSARPEQSIFEGIDTTIPGLARLAGLPDGALRVELQAIDTAVKRAVDEYQPTDPAKLVPTLVNGWRATRAAREALKTVSASEDARADADFLLAFKENDFTEALVRAAGAVIDPLADEETVVQGGRFVVNVRAFLPEGSTAKVTSATLRTPTGWTVEPAAPAVANPGRGGGGGPFGRQEVASAETRLSVTVPATAPPTQPYFVEEPRRGDQYTWTAEVRGLPFAPPLVTADVTMEIGRATVTVSRPVMYRYADRVRGELRREINVVPAVTVGVDSKFLIVPIGATANQQRLVVRAASFSPQAVSGTLRLRLPQGWTSQPASAPFTLSQRGDRTAATFTITAPPTRRAGTLEIVAEAQVGDAVYARDVQEVAYPHIQTHRLYTPSSTTAQVIDVKVAPVSVGYIMGTGDQVPDALRRLGINVTLIDDEALSTGDLSRFDTIVVGVRASEGRPAFVANNGRLRQYMEAGGTLIVQYQQGDYAQRELAPYPITAPTNSRVTEELAPVRILQPMHPAFTFPNQIGNADFDNWVQERNLYAFTTWDMRYVPLLESQDRGEMPQRGAELYADVGRGRYVYTAYSWFRQLPAGVPGAYRQFANLISLAKAPR
ncbi:MAG: PIG-L family deacetylase [Vicinamibacterales bacterium]